MASEKSIDVKEVIVVVTYEVALFSILAQGSTITSMKEEAKRA